MFRFLINFCHRNFKKNKNNYNYARCKFVELGRANGWRRICALVVVYITGSNGRTRTFYFCEWTKARGGEGWSGNRTSGVRLRWPSSSGSAGGGWHVGMALHSASRWPRRSVCFWRRDAETTASRVTPPLAGFVNKAVDESYNGSKIMRCTDVLQWRRRKIDPAVQSSATRGVRSSGAPHSSSPHAAPPPK